MRSIGVLKNGGPKAAYAIRATMTATPSLWMRHDADVGLRRLPALRIDRLRLVIADRARDDHVLALLPVGGRRDAVLCGELHGIDRAQDLREVAARGHWISERQLDLLVRA